MKVQFIKEISTYHSNIIILTTDSMDMPQSVEEIEKISDISLKQVLKNHKFEGKKGQSISIPTSSNKIQNITVISAGKIDDLDIPATMGIGKKIYSAAANQNSESATLYISPSVAPSEKDSHIIYDMLLGSLVSDYKFDKYMTKKKDDKKSDDTKLETIKVVHKSPNVANLEFQQYTSIHEGMTMAKDLVCEPPNVLNPEEFARRCQELKKTGLKVEILDKEEMTALGMNALLGVAQGSRAEPKLAIMRWEGGKKDAKPLAFVGKGVTFDTGGLSLKPAGAMLGMKYDMGGAAVVTGLMKTLALRNAKVNAVGVIGLVENMPDGNAQRPEDVVKSMSGQTIEILNTDAEGRLVLADALWYTQSMYKPEFMIDLATLTGAILVALANQYAGLFSNSDEISRKLHDAGIKTGEKVWRFPLDKEYDKMIDSKIADMQNIGAARGGAGSITAAQFLQRFVNDVPWAHLDIAGVTTTDKHTEISQVGATGFGVRLLNQFVRDNYES
ncbi:MAG: leucyl aminopeptidase [Alphaproteobacteria bacterium]|nr:leucyl aminopeptidase [Alphaproteobacteria bacterium]